MVARRGCAGGLVPECGVVDGSVEVYSHNPLNGVRKGIDGYCLAVIYAESVLRHFFHLVAYIGGKLGQNRSNGR